MTRRNTEKNWIAANRALRCSDAMPNDDGCSNLFNNVFDNDLEHSQPLQVDLFASWS